MYEKAPSNIHISYPLSSGVIADIKNMETLIKYFIGDLHLFCRCCGAIFDLPIKEDTAVTLARNHGFSPEGSIYIVNGVCKACSGD